MSVYAQYAVTPEMLRRLTIMKTDSENLYEREQAEIPRADEELGLLLAAGTT